MAVAKRDFEGMSKMTRRTPLTTNRNSQSAPAGSSLLSPTRLSPTHEFSPSRTNHQSNDVFLNTSKRRFSPNKARNNPSKFPIQQEIAIVEPVEHELDEFSLDAGDSLFSQISTTSFSQFPSGFSQFGAIGSPPHMHESLSTSALLPLRGTVDTRNRCMLVPRVRDPSSKDMERAKMKAARRYVTRFAMKILDQNRYINSKDLVDKLIQLTDGGIGADKIQREMRREETDAMMTNPPVWVTRMLSQRNKFICFVIFESWKKSIFLQKMQKELEKMEGEFKATIAHMQAEHTEAMTQMASTKPRQLSVEEMLALIDEDSREALARQLLKTVDPQTRIALSGTPNASPAVINRKTRFVQEEDATQNENADRSQQGTPPKSVRRQDTFVLQKGDSLVDRNATTSTTPRDKSPGPPRGRIKTMSFEDFPAENLLTRYLSEKFDNLDDRGNVGAILIASGKTKNWTTVLGNFKKEDPSAQDIVDRYLGMSACEVQHIWENETSSVKSGKNTIDEDNRSTSSNDGIGENVLTQYLSKKFEDLDDASGSAEILAAAGKTKNCTTVLNAFEKEDPSSKDIVERYKSMSADEIQQMFDEMTDGDGEGEGEANSRPSSPTGNRAGSPNFEDDADGSEEGKKSGQRAKSKKKKKADGKKTKGDKAVPNYGPNFEVPDYWKPFLKGAKKKSAGKEWTVKQLRVMILQIFDAKCQLDREALKQSTYKPQDTMSQFVTNYFLLTFGTRKLVEARLAAFVAGLTKHRDDWLVAEFSKFCAIYDPHPLAALGFFLSAFSIMLLSLMGNDVQRSGEKRIIAYQVPQMTQLAKCLRNFKAICKLVGMPKEEAKKLYKVLNEKQVAYAIPLRGANKDGSRTGMVVPAVELEVALSLVPALWEWTADKTNRAIEQAFHNFDLDNSGALEFEEFSDMVTSLHKESQGKIVGPTGQVELFNDPNEVRRLYLEVLQASNSEEVTLASLLSAAFKVASLRDIAGNVRTSMNTFARTQALLTVQRLLRNFIRVKRKKKIDEASLKATALELGETNPKIVVVE